MLGIPRAGILHRPRVVCTSSPPPEKSRLARPLKRPFRRTLMAVSTFRTNKYPPPPPPSFSFHPDVSPSACSTCEGRFST